MSVQLSPALATMQANVRKMADDLPNPGAVGYLLMLYDHALAQDVKAAEMLDIFGRPLLSTLETLTDTARTLHEARTPLAHKPILTAYQLARLRILVQPLVAKLPQHTALDTLLVLYDALEALELSPSQMESAFGPAAVTYLTGILYAEKEEPAAASEPPHPADPEQRCHDLPAVRLGNKVIPIAGSVAPDGSITFTPEAARKLGLPRRTNGSSSNGSGHSTDAEGAQP